MRLMLNALAVLAVCLMFSSLAQAQATRTWVSGVGDDANPCSRTAPCKTFAGAISKTAPKGEINVLDPGGFGAVTITKAITIRAECVEAGVLVSGTNGIIVAAGPSDDVNLEGLDIEGLGTGLSGIKFNSGHHLHVENCEIRQFGASGSNALDASLNQAGAAALTVNNCRLFNNNNVAIRVTITGGGTVTAQVTNTRINFAGFGVDLQAGTGTVSNCAISNVTNQALVAENNGTVLNAAYCTLNNNGTGISAFSSGSTIRFANCAIFNNTVGVNVTAGGTGDRFGSTALFGNGTDTVGTTTLRTQQ